MASQQQSGGAETVQPVFVEEDEDLMQKVRQMAPSAVSPLLAPLAALVLVAVIGFFLYKLIDSLMSKERKRKEKKLLKEQKKKK